ncbi:MAG: ABC transporter permease [Cyclobacteriaceae bacterium]|nr:ABC transporter permease [Cyclobacteriaceae bacterium]
MIIRQTWVLVKKEILIELRMKYALSGMILYLISSIFLAYITFSTGRAPINIPTWNVLFWIIMLFVATNSIAKSFIQESRERILYYYTIANPHAIILAKMVFNSCLMLFLVMMGFVIYIILLGNPVGDLPMFLLALLLGAIGFSTTFTMISSIASKASNSSTLMAILGFPVIVPILLLLIKISRNAIEGLARSTIYDEVLTLSAIIIIAISTSILLFPYLWRSN